MTFEVIPPFSIPKDDSSLAFFALDSKVLFCPKILYSKWNTLLHSVPSAKISYRLENTRIISFQQAMPELG